MKIYYLLVTFIFVILISGCAGTNIAQNLASEYGQIHDYDLRETYNYFDGSTKVNEYTYIQPAQQTTAGLLNSIETIARQFLGISVNEEEYNGKDTYVLVLTSKIHGKDEETTQVFWIDKETYLPLKMERYISGSDSLFEKLENHPEILNLAYGENAAQNMIFIISGWGYRLFTVDYEFSNINTRLDESIDCYKYTEETGTCITEVETKQQITLEDIDDVKREFPDILLPSSALHFTFSYVMPSQTEIVEEPYLFAENDVTEAVFSYCSEKFHGNYDNRCWKHDLDATLKVLQSDDPYLILSNLPGQNDVVETVTVGGKSAVFTDSGISGEEHQKITMTLRWKNGNSYFMIIFNDRAVTQLGEVLKGVAKQDMIEIAESMKPAQEIEI